MSDESLIFVSGGSSGIGRAMIEALPHRPARVFNLSRRAAPDSEHVAVDLAQPEAWSTAAACFETQLAGFAGERAVFVHSAGILTPIGFAGEIDPDGYRRNVLLNSAAPQVLGDAFLRAARGCDVPATLLFIGSGASTSVYEGWSGYCGGKAAVDHWTRTVGAERERRGGRQRVLCVAPGVVATAMQEEIRETPAEQFPSVDQFQALHDDGVLRPTADVARELWALVAREDLPNGAVLDVRRD
ncbi:MAG: SDR family NAD(P)-dependent oxidoreductase [Myxococcota bacterium]|nr:SDR family NAD(P)-dependent oxidoreductase [Myxococcota bacterium]